MGKNHDLKSHAWAPLSLLSLHIKEMQMCYIIYHILLC
jgi:hypothetical protein